MFEDLILPENWQEHPEVHALVEKAVRDTRAQFAGERDSLKQELAALRQELHELNEALARKAEEDTESKDSKAQDNGQAEPAAVKQLQERIRHLEEELAAKDKRLAEEVLERGLREAVSKIGEVFKDAWPDVIARGKDLFSIDEQGRPVARNADGSVLYGKDGLAPLGFEEWARSLLAEAPHLFKASAGSGGTGGQGQGTGQANNPVVISKEQARNPLLYRRAKERAAKLGSELIIQ
jgi:uncharacterized protein YukE